MSTILISLAIKWGIPPLSSWVKLLWIARNHCKNWLSRDVD